jgi:hypothetical protein
MTPDVRDVLAETVTVFGFLALLFGIAFTGGGAVTVGVPLMVGGLVAAAAGAYAGR